MAKPKGQTSYEEAKAGFETSKDKTYLNITQGGAQHYRRGEFSKIVKPDGEVVYGNGEKFDKALLKPEVRKITDEHGQPQPDVVIVRWVEVG